MASKPIPIRLSDSLLRRIKKAAVSLEMTDQDTMRFCMRLGLKILELSEFDAVTPVAEKAIKDREVSAKELVEGVKKEHDRPECYRASSMTLPDSLSVT